MKTKNIFKTLALALLLPAMLLTTACSNSDDDAVVNNNEQTAKKGYPLQVTVNVTREGDEAATRATFNGTKLEFSDGDKLLVKGTHEAAENFAGVLTWVSGGTFSGTILTDNPYGGTAEALLSGAQNASAMLLPAGYDTYGYLSIKEEGTTAAYIDKDDTKLFALTKAAAVEQFSEEYADAYSSGFALMPYNAILNFTISGLSASAAVDVALTGSGYNITRSVTTNGSGVASFAIGVAGGTDFNDLALTVGGNAIALASGSKTLTAGKVYNVNRAVGALAGKFSVSSTKQVYFSKGNLQAVGTTSSSPSSGWTWQFAEHQWDYIGGLSSSSGSEAQTGNNYISGNGTVSSNGTVDLFCWSTNATYYGIHNSYDNNDYSGDFHDWGNTMSGDWRTLTYAEWGYLFNTRTTTSGVRYAKAKVNNVNGVILLPDDWSTSYHALSSIDTGNAAFTANEIDASTWASSLEAHGAVFLPAAGCRYIDGENNNYATATELAGFYWSSVRYDDGYYNDKAYNFFFNPELVEASYSTKNGGCSVRLVKDAN